MFVLTLRYSACMIYSYNVSSKSTSSKDEQLLPCLRARQNNNNSILERWLKLVAR
jgi:hypothetical protein